MSLITRPSRLVFDADVDVAAALSDGIYAAADLPSFLLDSDSNLRNIITLGPLDGPHLRGGDLIPLLGPGGANNDTITIIIHRVSLVMDRGVNGTVRAYRTEKLYTIDLIASSMAYDAGTIHDTDAYLAVDTIGTPSLTARAGFMEAKVGASISVDSPEDNTQGVIALTDLDGAYGIIIEPTVSAGGGFNALFEPKT